MEEKKIIEQKILDSANEIPIPESLKPEEIAKRLKQKKKERRSALLQRTAQAAAAVVICAAIGAAGYKGFHFSADKGTGVTQENSVLQELQKDAEDIASVKRQKNASAGNLYHLADSYDDVYVAVRDREYAVEESSPTGMMFLPDKLETAEDGGQSAVNQLAEDDFSVTNLQVDGIEESDWIKTDGNYLYTASESAVHIVDLSGEKMSQAGEIRPALGASDQIMEMYLEKDRLYLIVNRFDSSLENGGEDGAERIQIRTGASVTLLTYDISDRTSPKEIGSVTQDGNYYTSRMAGGIIYLFSNYYPDIQKESGREKAIPYINGNRATAGCIYIPEDGGDSELVISSVNVENPKETIDQMVILNAGSEIYMGTESIYLYENSYEEDQILTVIAKFSYKDGYMNAVSAGSVKGDVEDKFAVSESNGIFRILTTDWKNGRQINQLYLLDQKLQAIGKIEDIAPGERIYAARYIGNMAYFITYRNMDPLFAADLSDPHAPVLLGSLEISGFSEYLHPYGENRLLGIGYETDPKSGEWEGVKLCMFDISDPVQLKTAGSTVIKDMDYVPALYQYKGILADSGKNLIGFMAEDYEDTQNAYYKVFRWDGNAFQEVLSQKTSYEDYAGYPDIRGAYAGKYFYVITGNEIISYNMEADFEEADRLEF